MTAVIPGDVETLLVVCPSWIGDLVMATPVLRAVRAARPDARLVVLVRRGHDELLAGNPWVDEVILGRRGLPGPFRTAALIRSRRCDAALLLPNSFRSALGVWLGGVPVRAGFARDARGRLLTHALTPQTGRRPRPLVEQYAALARWAFDLSTIDPVPALHTTEDEELAADRLLGGIDDPYVVINPGSNRADKQWAPERFAAVASRLHDAHGLTSVLIGAPREAEAARQVEGDVRGPVRNLVGAGLSLATLKPVIRRAALLLTGDSGPRHVAAALGTPAVALFGPTDHRWTTLPVTTERIILAEPFLPDTLVADDYPTVCRLDRIEVPDVLAAAESLLFACADRAGGAPPAAPPPGAPGVP